MAVFSIMVGATMQSIDMTIANVALPHMQGSLAATIDQIAWVLTSYIVASAVGTPLMGWLAIRYGQKLVLQAALAGFTVSSLLCGIATSLPEMVLYRTLQGLASAALLPLAQAVMMRLYPREYFAKAMAIIGIGMMLGPIAGPTLGGYVTEVANWRWVFFINLPLGVLAISGIQIFLDEHRSEGDGYFDAFGFAMLIIAIGAFQLMLDRGETKHWFSSTEIRLYAGMAALAFYMFVVQTVTARRPFVSRALFRDRNFVTGTLLFVVVSSNMMITVALQPPMLQNVMGYPVLTVGLLLAPRGVGTMMGMILSARLMNRFDVRVIVIVGLAFAAWGLWDLSQLGIAISEWDIVRSAFIQGFGLGLVFVQLNTIAFATLPRPLHIEGATMFNLMRALGSSAGLSIAVALLAQYTQINHAELAAFANPYNEALGLAGLPGFWSSLSDPAGLAMLNGEITRQAMMISFINSYHWLMVAALVGVGLMLFVRLPPSPLRG
ncbi:MAG: DHA2 family efflux MFS transporter permease subunit [Alphaproteobacteria bacterium]|nr:DHA2 family efflux MFS transporter permease subunit [Alphaproteobacteria bacterium]